MNCCAVALVRGIQNIDDGWWRFSGVAPLAKLLTCGCNKYKGETYTVDIVLLLYHFSSVR